MKRGNYRGKRRSLDGEKVMIVATVILLAILAMTVRVSAQCTGMSAGEQLREALFVAKDWD